MSKEIKFELQMWDFWIADDYVFVIYEDIYNKKLTLTWKKFNYGNKKKV